jgi:hypothetical protein
MLPLFVLSAPFIGAVAGYFLNDKTLKILCVLMVLLSVPWLVRNQSRRLISSKDTVFNRTREEQYFAHRKDVISEYNGAVEHIKVLGCKNIGLYVGADRWEYPLWILLNREDKRAYRIEHINVSNLSKKYEYPLGNFDVCAIIAIDSSDDHIAMNNVVFHSVWSQGSVKVFSRL